MLRARYALALILSVGMIGGAEASMKQTQLGALGDGSSGSVSNLFLSEDTFQDTVDFSLSSMSTISGFITAIRLEDANWRLTSGSTTISSGAFGTGSYSFADLAPGAYSISIFGGSQFISGYSASYAVSAVSAVPEAQTWLMILIGLGLVAFQLQRKHKTLPLQYLIEPEPRLQA
jgi:hypothetical protein